MLGLIGRYAGGAMVIVGVLMIVGGSGWLYLADGLFSGQPNKLSNSEFGRFLQPFIEFENVSLVVAGSLVSGGLLTTFGFRMLKRQLARSEMTVVESGVPKP